MLWLMMKRSYLQYGMQLDSLETGGCKVSSFGKMPIQKLQTTSKNSDYLNSHKS